MKGDECLKRGYLARFLRLAFGIVLSAVGIVLLFQANVGMDPWNVLHQGIARSSGISLGNVTILVGLAAIALAVVLGEHIGFGTLANIFGCGVLIDAIMALGLVPPQTNLFSGILMLLVGLEILTLGTYFYMQPGLGAGSRDALTVAIAKKTHGSVGVCRSALEVLVVLCGWLLGGKVGIGTVISALGIGIFFDLNFRLLHFDATGTHQETFSETLRNFTGKAGSAT